MAKKRQPLKTTQAKKGRKSAPPAPPVVAAVPVAPELSEELTPKQARFVEEYLLSLNAKQAAIRAGYSQKTAQVIGNENLTKPLVQRAIADARAKLSAKLQVEREDLLRELLKIAFANSLDYMRVLPNGEPAVDFSALTRDQAAAIAEFQVDDYIDGRGEDAREVKRVRFKLGDKRGAIMDAAKLLGHVEDRVRVNGEIGVRNMTMEDALARLREMPQDPELHRELLALQERQKLLEERIRSGQKDEAKP